MTENNGTRIKPAWQNFFRRLQSTTRNHDGIAVVQMIVVVKDGNPLYWAEPKLIKLEPRLNIDMETLRNELSNEALIELLKLIVDKS